MERGLDQRLAELERGHAATTSDIRGIYAGLDEIRDVLVRIQEGSRPNIGGMIALLFSGCTLVLLIGGLAFAPMYKDMTRINTALNQGQRIDQEALKDIGRLEAEVKHLNENLLLIQKWSSERHAGQNEQIKRLIDLTVENTKQGQYTKGYIDGFDRVRLREGED